MLFRSLSRRPEYRLEKEGDSATPKTILESRNFHPADRLPLPVVSSAGEGLIFRCSSSRIKSIPKIKFDEEFIRQIRNAMTQDETYMAGLQRLEERNTEQRPEDGIPGTPENPVVRNMTNEGGLLYYC